MRLKNILTKRTSIKASSANTTKKNAESNPLPTEESDKENKENLASNASGAVDSDSTGKVHALTETADAGGSTMRSASLEGTEDGKGVEAATTTSLGKDAISENQEESTDSKAGKSSPEGLQSVPTAETEDASDEDESHEDVGDTNAMQGDQKDSLVIDDDDDRWTRQQLFCCADIEDDGESDFDVLRRVFSAGCSTIFCQVCCDDYSCIPACAPYETYEDYKARIAAATQE